mmetsp:Transcript_21628/g.61609  ORF Transcript_21628/g.61609 Transcript_21628/m.61609 type:complete len:244 (-) Transcript_21628:647-1378(-)
MILDRLVDMVDEDAMIPKISLPFVGHAVFNEQIFVFLVPLLQNENIIYLCRRSGCVRAIRSDFDWIDPTQRVLRPRAHEWRIGRSAGDSIHLGHDVVRAHPRSAPAVPVRIGQSERVQEFMSEHVQTGKVVGAFASVASVDGVIPHSVLLVLALPNFVLLAWSCVAVDALLLQRYQIARRNRFTFAPIVAIFRAVSRVNEYNSIQKSVLVRVVRRKIKTFIVELLQDEVPGSPHVVFVSADVG